jgi:kynureninase
MAHERPFAFEDAPIEHAASMYRFGTGTPTIPGYVVAKPGHDFIRSVGVENVRAHSVKMTTKIAEMALERGLRVNSPLEPERRAGWIGIDFDDSARVCRELIAGRVFLDYRPGCGIRVSAHVYTTTDEIDHFFSELDRLRS